MAALMGNYSRIPLAIESAEGAYVTDETGKKYLDFTSGIAVCNLGHRHPAVELAVTEQLKKCGTCQIYLKIDCKKLWPKQLFSI